MSVDSARLSVDNWLRAKVGFAPTATEPRGSGAPDADRPEDWPTVSPRDAAAMTPREAKSHVGRFWLVYSNTPLASAATAVRDPSSVDV